MGTEETYIGDGVYASFDGAMIKLRVPREHDDDIVYLDTAVWSELLRFARSIPGWPMPGREKD